MTTPIKTQCPHCHAGFNLQKTQLHQASVVVRCDHCQQVFLANKHLIVTANKVTAKKSAINTDIAMPLANSSKHSDWQSNSAIDPAIDHTKPLDGTIQASMSINNQPLEALWASDALIHDDMDIEETEETSVEYDLLQGIDVWLAQASSTNKPHPLSNEQQKNNAKTLDKNADLTANSPLTAQLNAKADHKTPEKTAISSAAANNIHASINNTADNMWLEELLKEQNDDENGTQDDTDLAQLLINIGAPVNDEDDVNQVRARKIQARMQSMQMETQTSVAALLWAMGCLVLVLLLFAQYVIFNLDTLIKNSVYAERLQTVCSIAACSLPSAELTTMTVTNLNHRPSQVNATSAFSDVQATLNNQSAQAQLLPSLKVSVYGPNALIGEFIAMPNDYLLSPQNQLIAEGRKPFMFTIPVANDQISNVTFTPIY